MRSFVILLIVISFIGCNSFNKPEKPENLISKDKMVDIMYEVFILNAAKGANKSKLENKGIYPQDYIFEKYKIDSLQFAMSNEYYGFYVEDYESIIGEVEKRIEKDKDKYQELIDEAAKERTRKKDSIKQLSDSLRVIGSNKKSRKRS
ncbi:hypothetical protein A9Q86_14735 [Flavobacteriales bacterium 33_180_T64]|nr:hypothetical protein A9Q86_14735 [Flavobacteriales bacterium 33_180_T64]